MSLKKIEIEVLDRGYLVTAVSVGVYCYEFSRKSAEPTKEDVVGLIDILLTKNDEAKSKTETAT